jgi:hypothetical protein
LDVSTAGCLCCHRHGHARIPAAATDEFLDAQPPLGLLNTKANKELTIAAFLDDQPSLGLLNTKANKELTIAVFLDDQPSLGLLNTKANKELL